MNGEQPLKKSDALLHSPARPTPKEMGGWHLGDWAWALNVLLPVGQKHCLSLSLSLCPLCDQSSRWGDNSPMVYCETEGVFLHWGEKIHLRKEKILVEGYSLVTLIQRRCCPRTMSAFPFPVWKYSGLVPLKWRAETVTSFLQQVLCVTTPIRQRPVVKVNPWTKHWPYNQKEWSASALPALLLIFLISIKPWKSKQRKSNN